MLVFVKEGEEEEKGRKTWPVTCGTRRGDRREIIAVSGAYAAGPVSAWPNPDLRKFKCSKDERLTIASLK